MRIGADASFLRWPKTGIGRYLDGLLHALERSLRQDDEMFVYYNSWHGRALFGPAVRERFLRLKGAGNWNQVAVPIAARLDGCEVYLGGANVVPVVMGCPRVVVVHDCLVYADLASKPPRGIRYWRRWQRRSAHNASAIVAVSDWTARQCEEYLGISRHAVTVIHPGVDARFRPAEPAEASGDRERLRALGIRGTFVLQVGAFEPHKGGTTALTAVAQLRRRGHDVLIVRCGLHGARRRDDAAIDLGWVDDDNLLALYRQAAAVCVTSTHEGFGLPVVEAMAVGTPVVAARAGALPETCGDAALLAEPGDAADFGAQLERVLTSQADADRLRSAGRERARAFQWESAAGEMLAVLRRVATER